MGKVNFNKYGYKNASTRLVPYPLTPLIVANTYYKCQISDLLHGCFLNAHAKVVMG